MHPFLIFKLYKTPHVREGGMGDGCTVLWSWPSNARNDSVPALCRPLQALHSEVQRVNGRARRVIGQAGRDAQPCVAASSIPSRHEVLQPFQVFQQPRTKSGPDWRHIGVLQIVRSNVILVAAGRLCRMAA